MLRRAGVGAGGETGGYGRGVWDHGRSMQVSQEQLGRPNGLVSRRLVLVSVPSFCKASTEDHILRWEVLPRVLFHDHHQVVCVCACVRAREIADVWEKTSGEQTLTRVKTINIFLIMFPRTYGR